VVAALDDHGKFSEYFRMKMLRLLMFAPLALAGLTSGAAEKNSRDTIASHMQQLVDRGVIAGSVTLVTQHGKTVHFAAMGKADIAAGRAMKTDDIFWIASMTKPMTAVCVMMLAEQGKLSIHDPVSKFIPEFAGLKLHGAKPPRPITIRDLLTHTSGLGDARIAPKASLAERAVAYAHAPMKFAPGVRWEYCNGNFNTLGRIIEVVSGKSYETFLRQRLLSPLGMSDTTFRPSPRRVAKSYRPGNGGRLAETSVYANPADMTDRARPALPAGGLFSTASDVAKFYRMILGGGSLGGRKFLSGETVSRMTTTQTGGIRTGFVEGMSWGLGFQVVRVPQGVTAGLSAGSFGHGGSFATQSWVDPKRDAVFVLMIQRAGYANPDASEPRKVFQDTAASVLR
jgi:CubicO group peptidase (beta-lactamase class C family)